MSPRRQLNIGYLPALRAFSQAFRAHCRPEGLTPTGVSESFVYNKKAL